MKQDKAQIIIRKAGYIILCLLSVLGLSLFVPTPSKASHDNPTLFGPGQGALDNPIHVEGIHLAMNENWLAAWMMMTEQFVTVMMQQMFIIGTFLDAEQQLEVQRLFQKLAAEAHKDFHPSFQMCQFGTNMKSLAWADAYADENAKTLDTILKEREHLNQNLAAAGGISMDVSFRIRQFKDTYCDLNEANRDVELMCNETSGPITRRTKDIDYARTVDHPYTMNVNFLDADQTPEEQDLIALGRNLYAGTVLDFMPEQIMNETVGQALFLDTRSIHAIRSVARHSFTKIAGMKAEGEEGQLYEVWPYMHNVIYELGVPEPEIALFLGANPSYFAQMEVLTRKMYQTPEFFTNLYDKPANVRRTGVALQAIELMQDRDRFKSALRREMLISLILELKLRKYQEDVSSGLFAGSIDKFGEPDL